MGVEGRKQGGGVGVVVVGVVSTGVGVVSIVEVVQVSVIVGVQSGVVRGIVMVSASEIRVEKDSSFGLSFSLCFGISLGSGVSDCRRKCKNLQFRYTLAVLMQVSEYITMFFENYLKCRI